MRPCGSLSGSPFDAVVAFHTRLLDARAWRVNFSSKFNVPAGLGLKVSEFQSCFDFVVTWRPKYSTHHSQGSTFEVSMIIYLVLASNQLDVLMV
jgi:hypothetical protein